MYFASFSLSRFITLVTDEILKGFFQSIQEKKRSKKMRLKLAAAATLARAGALAERGA